MRDLRRFWRNRSIRITLLALLACVVSWQAWESFAEEREMAPSRRPWSESERNTSLGEKLRAREQEEGRAVSFGPVVEPILASLQRADRCWRLPLCRIAGRAPGEKDLALFVRIHADLERLHAWLNGRRDLEPYQRRYLQSLARHFLTYPDARVADAAIAILEETAAWLEPSRAPRA